jgi:IclR family acetate operon transcriptional repressor
VKGLIDVKKPTELRVPDAASGAGGSLRLSAHSDNTVVSRILTIIEAVASSEDGVGVRALARETTIDKSTISRLLRQLAAAGMFTLENGRYKVGERFFAVARLVVAQDYLFSAAHPYLQELAERFNETCYLGILEQDQLVYRDVIETTRPLRYFIALGTGVPLYVGAPARAVAFGIGDEQLNRLLGGKRLKPVTENTVTDRAALSKLIVNDRARGYSVSFGERTTVGMAVAAPFYGAGGRCLGSVSIVFPKERLAEHDVDEMGRVVAAACGQLSRRLGYAPRRTGGDFNEV